MSSYKQNLSNKANNEDLIKKLEKVCLFEIKLKNHEHKLKMALLNSSYFQESAIMLIITKKLIPAGILALMMLAVISGINLLNKRQSVGNLFVAQEAYAKEVVNKAIETLKSKNGVGIIDQTTGIITWEEPDQGGNIRDADGNIIFFTASAGPAGQLVAMPNDKSPEEQTAYVFAKDLLDNSFQVAQQAKDLSYLGIKTLPDDKKIKIIQFTDDYGNVNMIGIDENNLPIVKFVLNKDGEILSGGSSGTIEEGVQFPHENPTFDPKMEAKSQIEYWTENLE